jgi:molecular chaperone GrpE
MDADKKERKENAGENQAKAGDAESESSGGCPQGCVAVEDYKRLAADFDNYRRHAEDVASDGKARGKMYVISDLLPLLDDFDSAIEQYQKNEEVRNGLSGLRKRLFDTLKANGLEELAGFEGEKFDPEVCEAVRTDDKAKEGIISCELRKGYSFCGQILRHPMVVVGSAKADGGNKGEIRGDKK